MVPNLFGDCGFCFHSHGTDDAGIDDDGKGDDDGESQRLPPHQRYSSVAVAQNPAE